MVAACRLNHYSSGNWQRFPAVNTERTITGRRHNCLGRAHREAWLLEATVGGHASSIQHSSQQRGWQARVGMASQGALEQTRMWHVVTAQKGDRGLLQYWGAGNCSTARLSEAAL